MKNAEPNQPVSRIFHADPRLVLGVRIACVRVFVRAMVGFVWIPSLQVQSEDSSLPGGELEPVQSAHVRFVAHKNRLTIHT